MDEASAAVVGGHEAGLSDIFATVELRRPGARSGFCTGTLVAPRIVVTAAHCLVVAEDEDDDAMVTVHPRRIAVAGGHLGTPHSKNVELVRVAAVIVHPAYNHDFVLGRSRTGAGKGGIGLPNDIGVLVLDVPMTSVEVAPVLPQERDMVLQLQGSVGWIAGYGVYDLETSASGRLHVTDALIDHLGQRELLTRRTDDLGDSCFGDSGGPLYIKQDGVAYLVGLVSRGRTDVRRDCGDGGVYTFLPFYGEWIAAEVGDMFDPEGVFDGMTSFSASEWSTQTIDGGCAVSAPGRSPTGMLMWLFAFGLSRRRRRQT